MEKIEPGDVVRINEDTSPEILAGQVTKVVSKIREYPDGNVAYMVAVSHTQHGELVYFGQELTLLQKGKSNGE